MKNHSSNKRVSSAGILFGGIHYNGLFPSRAPFYMKEFLEKKRLQHNNKSNDDWCYICIIIKEQLIPQLKRKKFMRR